MGARNGRVLSRELLDDEPDDSAARVLADLRRLNRWFGGHAILRSLAGEWFAREERFRVLDVGAATGDMGGALRSAYRGAEMVSLDRSLRNLHFGTGGWPRVCADAFRLPFDSGSFDLVYSSLFLHHFDNSDAIYLLREMRRVARRTVLVIDLERSWVGRNFPPLTKWLLGWDPVTIHDGIASVRAGFRAGELRELAECAGWRPAAVRRHVPWCRLSVSAPGSHG